MTAPPPDPAAEDALIPLSALQHYLFCPRQCALIHVEQVWAENAATTEGKLLHERVDAGGAERRPGVRIERGVALRSLALGVAHRADEVQLCAQAMCLEEMSGLAVPEGALFYGENRRRTVVAFDAALRALTADVARQARAMIAGQVTPPPVLTPGCRRCSLQDVCAPERLEKPPVVARWLSTQWTD
jgi:CRISPR-associated exonuclease Cas4